MPGDREYQWLRRLRYASQLIARGTQNTAEHDSFGSRRLGGVGAVFAAYPALKADARDGVVGTLDADKADGDRDLDPCVRIVYG